MLVLGRMAIIETATSIPLVLYLVSPLSRTPSSGATCSDASCTSLLASLHPEVATATGQRGEDESEVLGGVPALWRAYDEEAGGGREFTVESSHQSYHLEVQPRRGEDELHRHQIHHQLLVCAAWCLSLYW